ncbi:hypothetical protein L1887_42062 [Cichorium endivia]|nr:hypothetical protein L1887_42062 [Cichorium endivia]
MQCSGGRKRWRVIGLSCAGDGDLVRKRSLARQPKQRAVETGDFASFLEHGCRPHWWCPTAARRTTASLSPLPTEAAQFWRSAKRSVRRSFRARAWVLVPASMSYGSRSLVAAVGLLHCNQHGLAKAQAARLWNGRRIARTDQVRPTSLESLRRLLESATPRHPGDCLQGVGRVYIKTFGCGCVL